MLTRKQQELLILIRDRLEAEGVPPSFDEMKDALGLASKSGIHRLISGLEERGFIRRLPHRARALEIVRLPENMVQVAPVPFLMTGTHEAVALPLYGKIAAGTAIEAICDQGQEIMVPPDLLPPVRRGGRPDEHYVLEVAGDSMVEAGILNGDRVIIRRTAQAETGAIVVALIDKQEVTLKRYRPQKGKIALEPANRAYDTMIFDLARVQIQGELVGLMRRY